MANDQALQAVSDFKASFEKSAQHYKDKLLKENTKFYKGGLRAVFISLSVSLKMAEPIVLLHNASYFAARDLAKVEDLIKQNAAAGDVISKLQDIKTEFGAQARYLKDDVRFNPSKKARIDAEFKGYSKKLDEIIKLI